MTVAFENWRQELERHAGALQRLCREFSWPHPQPSVIPTTDIRAYLASRRRRDRFFPGQIFADPAWDMLLDLWAATNEGRQVSVSSLCFAAAVPATTALRWIALMEDRGWFTRVRDPSDHRRTHVRLTRRAITAMRGYLADAAPTGLLAPEGTIA